MEGDLSRPEAVRQLAREGLVGSGYMDLAGGKE